MLKARGKLISLLTACMSLVLMLVMGITTLSIQPKVASAATGAWTLVTDVSTLSEGDKVIIVASSANYALSTTQNGNNRGQAAITKDSATKTVTFSSGVQELTLKNGKTSGTFAFYTGSGYLYAASSSNNYLRTETSLSANSSFTISITSAGVATVKATGSNTRNLIKYNSSSKIFACYSSGQGDICLYEYVETVSSCAHTETETATTPATCVVEGTIVVTCKTCGETVSEETISALGHDDTENVVQDATCTEAGSKTLTCNTCSDVREVVIPATGHNYVDGFCSVCGAKEPTTAELTLTFDENKANRVSFSTTKQVWSQNGITFTNNKASSTTNIADYGAPVRLYAGSEIIIESLNMSKIIFNCNTTGYATELKNSIGNDATVSGKVVTVKFNELTNEFTVAKLTAQVRLDSITVTMEIIVDDGCQHANMQYVEAKASTCFQKGNIAYYYCEDCKTYYNENEEIIFQVETEIPLDKHTEVTIPAQEKTCTTDGSTEGVKCSVCDTVITAPTTIPAGHTYIDGACSMCGEAQPAEATLTFDNTEKRTEFSTSKQVWQEKGIIVTNNKASSTTNVADYVKPARFYKNSEIIIEYAGMIKIEFTCNSKDSEYITHLKNSIKDITPTANGNIVTIEFTEAIDNYEFVLTDGAVWLDSITVYTEKQEAGNEGVGVEIDSASVTLGDDIALNYYVAMNGQIENVTMKITLNGEVCDQELPEPTDGRYKISFELPPQYMANEITVDLLVDDVVVDSKVYSVKMYAQDILNNSKSTDEVKRLVSDMLYYGAAAQKYKGYNVENLATDEVENLLAATDNAPDSTNFTLVKNSEISSYPAYFTGAGVHFADVNKIYVKLSTTENVTLKINGEDVAVNGTTVYTDGIKATEFGTTYTFELYCDGVLMQTLTYSVNAYAYAKQGESAMGELALALYRYGKSAKAYAGE